MNPKIFAQILEIAFQKKVSDIHFEVDNPPFFRIHGQLVRSKLPNLVAQDTEAIVGLILKHNDLAPGGTVRELDTSYALPGGGGRFRVSIFRQRRQFGIVMRAIPPKIATFQELNLPDVLGDIVQAQTGLVLVTGPTGNGKTTAMSSMIQFLNDTCNYNILTIEDPIEFLFTSRTRAASSSARSAPTRRASTRRSRRRCAWTRTSSWSARCATGTPSTPASRPRRPATSCSRRCTRRARSPRSTASSATTRPTRRRSSATGSPTSSWRRSRCASILNKSGEQLLPVVEVMRSTGTIQGCIRDGRLEEIDRHIASGGSLYKMQTQDQHLLAAAPPGRDHDGGGQAALALDRPGAQADHGRGVAFRSRAGCGVLSLRTSIVLRRWRPPLRATPTPGPYQRG